MSDHYTPEPGHYVRTDNSTDVVGWATEVVVHRNGYTFGFDTDDGTPHTYWPATKLVRYTRISDTEYVRRVDHPIDDRLPALFTVEVIRWARFVVAAQNRYLNCDTDGHTSGHTASVTAERNAYSNRFARVDPDGTIWICDGKEVIGKARNQPLVTAADSDEYQAEHLAHHSTPDTWCDGQHVALIARKADQ